MNNYVINESNKIYYITTFAFSVLIKGEDEEHHKKQGECKIEKFKKCAKREQFIAKWVPLYNFALIKVLTLDILSSQTNINYSKAVDCAQASQCSYYFGINEEQNTESS